MSQPIPVPVIAIAYALDPRTVRRWAANGRLGPITTQPGFSRKRTAEREEVERRLGALPPDVWKNAWAKHRHVAVKANGQ